MGNHFAKRKPRALLVGLDTSGKTSLLYRITSEIFPQTVPTIGVNVETLKLPVEVTLWDVGGIENQRGLWSQCYCSINIIIFVVDSSDRGRLMDCKSELSKLIQNPATFSIPVLVLANKQDVENSLSAVDVAGILNLGTLMAGRSWNVIGTSASSGEGVGSVVSWISLRSRLKRGFKAKSTRSTPSSPVASEASTPVAPTVNVTPANAETKWVTEDSSAGVFSPEKRHMSAHLPVFPAADLLPAEKDVIELHVITAAHPDPDCDEEDGGDEDDYDDEEGDESDWEEEEEEEEEEGGEVEEVESDTQKSDGGLEKVIIRMGTDS